jgi:hypothetical protein
VRIEQMKMGFTFPGSQLKPLEKSEESTSLSSMDGLGVFTVSALKAYGTARIAEKDLVSYRDTLESAMNKNTPGGLNVIERDQKTDPLQYYFKATYKSEDGAERYFFAGISGWVNAKDKTHHLYAVVLDCPESQAAVYQRLYDRLFASCIDI